MYNELLQIPILQSTSKTNTPKPFSLLYRCDIYHSASVFHISLWIYHIAFVYKICLFCFFGLFGKSFTVLIQPADAEKRDMEHSLYTWIVNRKHQWSFCSTPILWTQCILSHMDSCTGNSILHRGGRWDNRRLEFFNSTVYAFNFEQSVYILVDNAMNYYYSIFDIR